MKSLSYVKAFIKKNRKWIYGGYAKVSRPPVWQSREIRLNFIGHYGYGLIAFVLLIFVAKVMDGYQILGNLIALNVCMFVIGIVAYGLTFLFEGHLVDAPTGEAFTRWALASTVLGLSVGHLCIYLFDTFLPYDLVMFRLDFEPEFFTALIVVVAYFGKFRRGQWQKRLDFEILKREAAEHGQALAQAQLKMLQAQIEPHFLFNTLASVQHLVRKDPPRADFLLSQLIRYLREAMPDIRSMGSTLGREFGLAEAYLNIVQIRLDGRLEIKVTIPHELADISFPALIVQTLVENAIKHGIEPKPGPVHIDVTASELMVEGKQFIDVCVSDDGVGFGVAETMGTGVGLRNIRERLAGLYGTSARLCITEVKPSGVCATVRIPRVNSGLPVLEQVSTEESFLAQSRGGISQATRGSK